MSQRERVVVLGGGIASLTTAFHLTEQPDWADRYDITVYQLGWRLGGKAASGVNQAEGGRVEEHGLHVWFGFYQNAFRLMRECYGALGRPASHPMPTAESAFQPVHHHTFLDEDNDWMPWSYRFSGDGVLPGAPCDARLPESVPRMPGVWGSVRRVLSWVKILLQEHPRLRWIGDAPAARWMPERPPWRREASASTLGGVAAIDWLMDHVSRAPAGRLALPVVLAVRALRSALLTSLGGDDPGLVRLRVMLDLSLTGVSGVLADDLGRRGYRAVDDEDFRAWLLRHGALEASVRAPIVRTLYDIFFAYEGGDTDRPAVAAGATLRGMFRLLFSYHGAVLWKMNAGMGDAIIAPLYQLLARRGVRFRFFHAVDHLGLDESRRGIERIGMTVQARLRRDEYRPLIDVRGLPCWPTEPLWDQLEDADALRGRDLERPGPGEPLELRRGRDFDRVVLGISLGALPSICGELVEARSEWREMLEKLGTVRTQALQLWFRGSLAQTGASWPSGMLAAYAQPFSSWSDFTQVLDHEQWEGDGPRYLAYSCGVLPDAPDGPPDGDEATDVVRANAQRWLDRYAGPIWPATVTEDGRFRWEVLHDPRGRTGAARLEGQYVRANTAPSERYVLALPGTTRYRLHPARSGFDNLVLCGSWTDNHYTLSCIEATVMSGMMAARAVDGRPRRIVGEHDGEPVKPRVSSPPPPSPHVLRE